MEFFFRLQLKSKVIPKSNFRIMRWMERSKQIENWKSVNQFEFTSTENTDNGEKIFLTCMTCLYKLTELKYLD